MELISTFEYKKFKVSTFYVGTEHLVSHIFIDKVCVLRESTYRPSPMYGIESDEAMAGLLSFLVLKSGDVEQDYFDRVNCPQLLEWSENSEEAEDIRLMLNDFEFLEDEEWLADNEMTAEEAGRISNYIKS